MEPIERTRPRFERRRRPFERGLNSPAFRWLAGGWVTLWGLQLIALVLMAPGPDDLILYPTFLGPERARPLIAAIEAHDEREGAPPIHLSDLVPRYLEAIPTTGLLMYDDWGYSPDSPYGRWDLTIDCPAGFLNWDTFSYPAPPNIDHRGDLERIGDWAYDHE